LIFAKCIVQSSPTSFSKLFTGHHTLLNLVNKDQRYVSPFADVST
jgi:hypothetical protein